MLQVQAEGLGLYGTWLSWRHMLYVVHHPSQTSNVAGYGFNVSISRVGSFESPRVASSVSNNQLGRNER